MIYVRGKFLYVAFALAARDAARRFMSRRGNARSRRDAWRPIVLRWRQRRRRFENVPAGRAVPQPKVSWFPQFHFHFASYMGDRTRRNTSLGLSPAAGIRQTPVVMDHRWTSVPTATPPLQLGSANRPLREIYERNSPRPKDHATVTTAPRVSWPPVAQQLVAWSAHRPRRLPFGRMPEGVRSSMQREGQTQFLQTRSLTWQHWHQVFSLRQPKFSNPVPHRASESRALQFQYDRPEELVWRRLLRTPANSDDDKRGLELSESFSRPPVRLQPGQEAALSASAPIERTAAMQVTKLDPSLLDRLTDDVIRRVEQRARIERERRGL